jgi:hypothetical protein
MIFLFPGGGRGSGGAPASVFLLGWTPAFAGERGVPNGD